MLSSHLDDLYQQVAKKMLAETLHAAKGEALAVETWNNGLDFARHVVVEARAMGCTAVMLFEDEQAYVEGVRRAPKESLGVIGKNEYNLLSGTDAYVFIPGQALGAYSKTLTPDELSQSTRYNSSWYDAAEKAKLRGARLAFGYVGKDLAKMLGKSIEDIVRGQLKAALTDYAAISERARSVGSRISDGAEATLESGGASLRFVMKGELEIQDGLVDERDVATGYNMAYVPPGLVSKGVDPDTVEGKVRVSASLTKFGVLGGAELEFRGGRLAAWKSPDKTLLERLLDLLPQEKRKLTLLGVGTNPAMKYGLGQDRFVGGAVTLGGLGFTAVVKKASLLVGGGAVLDQGTPKA
jgi:leucyl aminopeptidase (aminopeptidase T)